MTKPILSVNNLSARFFNEEDQSYTPVLNDISFHVNENEVFGIIGESGSGKSITLLSVLGLLQANPGIIKGEIIFNNVFNSENKTVNTLEDIEKYIDIKSFEKNNEEITIKNNWKKQLSHRYKEILGKQVSMVFQNPRLAFNPYYSIGKQISESILLHKPDKGSPTKAAAKALAIDWLRRVKMEAPELRYNNNPYGLSGGMCQRAMIAMALASSPRLLIADEPTTGLDATIQGDILSLLEELKTEEKLSMIIVSHDFNVMKKLANRIAVYYKGFIIEEGYTSDILSEDTKTHHPYTSLLLNTEYKQGTENEKEKEDNKPNAFFSTCPYYANCKIKTSEISEKCENTLPPLISITPNDEKNIHRIRCWMFSTENFVTAKKQQQKIK